MKSGMIKSGEEIALQHLLVHARAYFNQRYYNSDGVRDAIFRMIPKTRSLMGVYDHRVLLANLIAEVEYSLWWGSAGRLQRYNKDLSEFAKRRSRYNAARYVVLNFEGSFLERLLERLFSLLRMREPSRTTKWYLRKLEVIENPP